MWKHYKKQMNMKNIKYMIFLSVWVSEKSLKFTKNITLSWEYWFFEF